MITRNKKNGKKCGKTKKQQDNRNKTCLVKKCKLITSIYENTIEFERCRDFPGVNFEN